MNHSNSFGQSIVATEALAKHLPIQKRGREFVNSRLDLETEIKVLNATLADLLATEQYLLVPNFGNSVADLAARPVERTRTVANPTDTEALDYLGNVKTVTRYQPESITRTEKFLDANLLRLRLPSIQEWSDRPNWILFNLDLKNPELEKLGTLTVQQVAATMFAIEATQRVRVANLMKNIIEIERTSKEVDVFSDGTNMRIAYVRDESQTDHRKKDKTGKPVVQKTERTLFIEPNDLYFKTGTNDGSFGAQILGDTINSGTVLTGTNVFCSQVVTEAKGLVLM